MKPQTTTHRSLLRGLGLIEVLAAAGQPLGLVAAAGAVGLHRSTAHHLLQTLVAAGYVQQERRTRAYTLAPRLHGFGARFFSPEQVATAARPLLERLTRHTGVGSSVAVWRCGAVTIVAKQECDGPVRVVQDVGAQREIHCTAVGKAIAAWLPQSELEAVLARTRLRCHTERTITSRAALLEELRRVRASGFALDDEEHYPGLRCIATPVRAHTGQVIAAVCIVGPKQQLTRVKLAAVRAPLAQAAQELSARLGYVEPQAA